MIISAFKNIFEYFTFSVVEEGTFFIIISWFQIYRKGFWRKKAHASVSLPINRALKTLFLILWVVVYLSHLAAENKSRINCINRYPFFTVNYDKREGLFEYFLISFLKSATDYSFECIPWPLLASTTLVSFCYFVNDFQLSDFQVLIEFVLFFSARTNRWGT